MTFYSAFSLGIYDLQKSSTWACCPCRCHLIRQQVLAMHTTRCAHCNENLSARYTEHFSIFCLAKSSTWACCPCRCHLVRQQVLAMRIKCINILHYAFSLGNFGLAKSSIWAWWPCRCHLIRQRVLAWPATFVFDRALWVFRQGT